MAQALQDKNVLDQARRRQLKDLGVTDEQIEVLEIYLPACRGFFRRSAPFAEVRSVINELSDSLEKLRHALQGVSGMETVHAVSGRGDNDQRDPRDEVFARLILAAYEEGLPNDLIAESLGTIARLARVVAAAAAKVPNTPRRHQSANPSPVGMIHQALVHGWGKTYCPTGDDRVSLEEVKGLKPMPQYPFTPKSTQTSPFYCVVAICYEALLGEGVPVEPERAVKAFIRERTRALKSPTDENDWYK